MHRWPDSTTPEPEPESDIEAEPESEPATTIEQVTQPDPELTPLYSSAASDVYKRQEISWCLIQRLAVQTTRNCFMELELRTQI